MKRLYWRPREISRRGLLLIALLSMGSIYSVERFRLRVEQPNFKKKIAAARLAKQAFEAIRDERIHRSHYIDPESDPIRSGLIGSLITPVTSNTGHLPAKQTAINPNFAAVMVHMLLRAGVKEGDTVAIGFSGSFPSMNIATLAAVETLKLHPIIVSSASASQWGANDPEFLWIDMERLLYEKHIFSNRSIAASPGGVEDRAMGMSKKGKDLLNIAIERNGLRKITSKSFSDSINQHMALYQELAGNNPIKVYINVGGGTTSVGTTVGKKMFQPGLNLHPPASEVNIDSVMKRFIDNDVPVIHVTQIEKLARRYGLPLEPRTMPAVGDGKIFFREEYNQWLAGSSLFFILISLYSLIRSDIGYRILHRGKSVARRKQPEPML